jgi:hypothetical protein
MLKTPSLLVEVGNAVPRLTSFAVTVAFATGAPDGSVTDPVMEPVTAWPQAGNVVSTRTASKHVANTTPPSDVLDTSKLLS